ncbi:hypothetical protein SISSUDRAFT_1045536 [Sistotremastrum suecicum HHB10207 ss-3]|uniref:Uncharacterized protein n=1 Tax=Sistotremastrum suecicum HHB10207 ss-3 TaxID=1314776 RepID=A0A166EEM0_9AGAM|nr:hypothetical protein SISSUDRAFT_1045536 [Sistotremastrum suecicum HHB10207 ss-3]
MDGIIERSRRDINKAQYKINAAIDERWEKKTREKIASFDDSRLTPADRSREWFSSLFTGNDLKSARVAKQAEAMWADALIWFKQNRGEQLKERHEKLMKEATDLRGPVKDLRERVKEALSKTDSVSAKLSEGLDSLGRVKDALDPIKNRSKDAGIVFTSESLKRKLAAIVVCIDENQIAVGRFLALPSAPDHALRRLEVEFNDLEGI